MCGFVTIVTGEGATVSSAVLERMTGTLVHRGPDDFGYACIDPAGGACHTWTTLAPGCELSGILFGHRRLSILDLSDAGHQPMVSDDTSSVLSFNGEIYNFVELRAELEAQHVAFRGRGDTEVLLKAYDHWGMDTLAKCNGMWAFTLWDGPNRKLIASRDRFGVKPLYYTVVDGTWLFASEIKALLAYPGAFRGFDEHNVLDYLAYCLVDHGETTFYRGVRALPPGTYLELSAQHAKQHSFWTLRVDSSGHDQSERARVAQFRDLLADSVRLRVRSDVPIGTMLSGGLDSTSITALIHERQRLSRTDSPGEPIAGLAHFHHTFSICWPGWESDEEAAIDTICQALGLLSHKLYPTGEQLAELLPSVTYFLEQPFETPTALVQYLLMREARARGVKVVLNGHGSDELLSGYANFFAPPFLAGLVRSGQVIRYLREQQAFQAGARWSRRDIVLELFRDLAPVPLKPHVEALFYSPARQRRTLGIFPEAQQTAARHDHEQWPDIPPGLSPLNAALWLKFTEKILPMWLRMEDRVSMACSVESRLPFMDYRLVEFAFRLPDELKMRDGYTKYILRRAMQDQLPEQIIWNRVKQRFTTPYHQWFRGAWRPVIEDLLLGSCQVQPYIDMPAFRNKLLAYMADDNTALDARLLWRVLTTEICLRTFGASSGPRRP